MYVTIGRKTDLKLDNNYYRYDFFSLTFNQVPVFIRVFDVEDLFENRRTCNDLSGDKKAISAGSRVG